MGMTNEQLLQSITTVIVDRFDMLDGRIERLEQRVDKMDTEFRQKFEQIDQKFEQIGQKFEQIDRKFEQIDRKFEQIDRSNSLISVTVSSMIYFPLSIRAISKTSLRRDSRYSLELLILPR